VSAIVADTIRRIQKISCFWYRLLPTDIPNVFSKIKKTLPGSEPARPRSELTDPLLQRHALPYAGDGDAGDEAAGVESERCTHSELRRRAHAREHLVHVAPKEAATGPNLEEAGGSEGVQSKGGRSARLGKKGGASLLMPLGKKRGAPRSPRLHAAAPPDATADGEEEGSVVVCSLMRHRASLCHCRCWRRREEHCCRWGRRGECSSCLAADRSPEWRLSSILVPEQWRAAELEEWREREILDRVDEDGRAV
jgi:hypothetical protein